MCIQRGGGDIYVQVFRESDSYKSLMKTHSQDMKHEQESTTMIGQRPLIHIMTVLAEGFS